MSAGGERKLAAAVFAGAIIIARASAVAYRSRSYLVFFPYCSWGSGPVATKSHLNNLHVLGQGEPQFDRAND
jgi:hypothetical protein